MTVLRHDFARHATLLALLALCVLALCACDRGQPAPPEAAVTDTTRADTAGTPAADAALNPVQREMRLLDEAVRTSITSLANNTPQVALAGFERVHAARAETEAYLHSGQYAPLADHDSLEAFAAQDAAFHEQLEHFAHELEAGAGVRAAQALGPLMQSCVECHQRFRFRTAQ